MSGDSTPRAAPLDRAGLRTQLLGLLTALWLLSGRWSLSRTFDVDDSFWVQPRTWAVASLVIASLLPGTRTRANPRPSSPIFVTAGAMAFLAWMITSTAWSPDLALGQAKAAELALMVIATAVIARSVTTSDSVVYLAAVWRWLLVILAALALLGLAGAASGSRAAVLGGGPNIFGRNMGLLTVASLWLALGRRSVVWALVATLAASLCVLSGSRGAMIATASALSVVLVARRASMTRSALILAVTGLLGFALLLWTDLGIQTLASFRHRVIDLLIEQRYGSARELLYPRALELAGRHPIVGGGLAAFGAENVWRYPHNLFLEALCEGGVVGLVVLAVPLLHWGGTIALRGRGAIDVNVAALVLFLVASQFSGDVFDSRGVFAFLVLSSAYSGVIAWGQEREP